MIQAKTILFIILLIIIYSNSLCQESIKFILHDEKGVNIDGALIENFQGDYSPDIKNPYRIPTSQNYFYLIYKKKYFAIVRKFTKKENYLTLRKRYKIIFDISSHELFKKNYFLFKNPIRINIKSYKIFIDNNKYLIKDINMFKNPIALYYKISKYNKINFSFWIDGGKKYGVAIKNISINSINERISLGDIKFNKNAVSLASQ